MKKALILGAAGFVGSYLAAELKGNGYSVYGSDKAEMSGPDLFRMYVQADLLDFSSVRNLISDICPDVVINLAAISSVGMSWNIPQTVVQVNVVGALNILEAVRNMGMPPRVMFIGSSEEYASSDAPLAEDSPIDANNPYGISKITQERFAALYRAQYGLRVYCVRSFNHTGIGQRSSFVLPSFCAQVADIEKTGAPGVINVGNLSAIRDFSDVRDIVRAYRTVVESEDCSIVYNIGSGKAYSLRELLDYIVSLSSQRIAVNVDAARFRPVDTPFICCDNSLIKEKLGWEPRYSIKDTLREMFLHCLSH